MMKQPLLLLTTGYETSQLTRFETIFNKYFNKLLSKTKSSVKSNEITTLFTAEKLAIVFNKLEIYLNNANNSSQNNNLHINFNLIDILSDVNFLFYAWCLIKDKGEKMSGIDQIPIQNIGSGTLLRLSNDLKNGTYKPKPASRIYITKPDGSMRPLGVPTTRDKIVQKALTLILEPLFESIFSNNSHGFRPQRSCHTALDQIRREWRMVSYFIEIDLAKCFDTLGHKLILESIYKKCPNKSIVQIINKMLKCGYVNLRNASDTNLEQLEGTSLGSIISPLLANIALDNFDKHIENLILPKYSSRQKNIKAQVSEEYSKATKVFDAQDYELRDDFVKLRNLTTRQAKQIVLSLKAKHAIKDNIKYTKQNEHTERLWYARYADDMLFGFVGPKHKAHAIMSEIVAYLQNIGVSINVNKSGIKHHAKGISFLSYNIFGNYTLRTKQKNKYCSKGQRVSRTTLHFSAPVKVLLQRALERGFFMSNKKGRKINSKIVARRYDKWLFLEPHVIVSRFKYVINGIINYYQGCEQRSDLYELLWMYKRSCALTLSSRHKKQGHKWAFVKYGQDLKIEYNLKSGKTSFTTLEIPSLSGGGRFKKKASNSAFPSSILHAMDVAGNYLPKTLSSIMPASDVKCSIPNCLNTADHWHHIKHRRKANKKNQSIVKHQINLALYAKQIPVCKNHHNAIHNGTYNGPALRSLKGYSIEDVD